MEKKSRSYQNTGMSYGGVINEALAPWNTAAIYPSSLSGTAIGFPAIQYQETDWQFVKRMASRFRLSLYPEPSIGGSKMYVGIPETGNTCELEAREYASICSALGVPMTMFVTGLPDATVSGEGGGVDGN